MSCSKGCYMVEVLDRSDRDWIGCLNTEWSEVCETFTLAQVLRTYLGALWNILWDLHFSYSLHLLHVKQKNGPPQFACRCHVQTSSLSSRHKDDQWHSSWSSRLWTFRRRRYDRCCSSTTEWAKLGGFLKVFSNKSGKFWAAPLFN